jgi:cobyrinic acid a,c-diamide synthase
MRAFVIAGTHSGSGKTTVTLGIMAALAARGLSVQPFKAGPDFIDSGLHRLATGRVSRNLDLWMCGEKYVRSTFGHHAADTDVSIVEGVMGLYDGNLSTASLARCLDLPVILVVDGYGMAESAGPIVEGFRGWEAREGGKSLVRGVIFNRVASPHHYARLCAGVRDVPVFGYLPRDLDFEIPHRHLGLVVAEEDPLSAANLSRLAETIAAHVDLDGLLELGKEGAGRVKPVIGPTGPIDLINRNPEKPVRIAVALDKAFCFYYRDNLDLLEEVGGEIVFFSPLTDSGLPADIDAVYLGGGYPELYVAQLSENSAMRASIRAWSDSGRCLYAECGGLMYLSRGIRDFDSRFFAMTGVFGFDTAMTRGRANLGYREAILREDSLLGRAGETIRGHEFHYSAIQGERDPAIEAIYDVRNGSGITVGPEGFRHRNPLASYIHCHFGSNVRIAPSIIESATKGRNS